MANASDKLTIEQDLGTAGWRVRVKFDGQLIAEAEGLDLVAVKAAAFHHASTRASAMIEAIRANTGEAAA
jgi:hypothetical protein